MAELLARSAAMNFYELLEVDPSSTVEAVQAKYEALARQVHPANEAAYGLTGLEAMLCAAVRACHAGVTSCSGDPERRRQYNRARRSISPREVTGAEREVESKELARTYFEQALSRLVARGDFHFGDRAAAAGGAARPTVGVPARAGAASSSRNPKWRNRALDSCRAALELDPNNAEVRFEMGESCTRQGRSRKGACAVHRRAARAIRVTRRPAPSCENLCGRERWRPKIAARWRAVRPIFRRR